MFCTKCGKEIGEGRMFCSSCGAPAPGTQPSRPEARPVNPAGATYGNTAPAYTAPRTSAPAGIPGTVIGFGARITRTIKNIGVNCNLYVGYILTLVLSWIFVNTPCLAVTATVKYGDLKEKAGFSFSFGQINDIANLDSSFDAEGLGGFMLFISIIMNLLIIAAIVMALIPVFTGLKTSSAVALVGIITTSLALLAYLIVWFIMAVASWDVGSRMGSIGSVYMGPSLAGYWYVLAAILGIVLAVFVMKAVAKSKKRMY